MADIVDNSDYESKSLLVDFKRQVGKINKEFKDKIKSPLTITLGDEFQGIIADLQTSLKMIIRLEELRIELATGFKLRYVLGFGEVDTPIMLQHSHGMLGAGLTQTRKRLEELKKSFVRFKFIAFPEADHLNKLFALLQHFLDSWHEKDLKVVTSFLKESDYKVVAKKMKRDPSSMWRRERSLAIAEYRVCKDLILGDAGN